MRRHHNHPFDVIILIACYCTTISLLSVVAISGNTDGDNVTDGDFINVSWSSNNNNSMDELFEIPNFRVTWPCFAIPAMSASMSASELERAHGLSTTSVYISKKQLRIPLVDTTKREELWQFRAPPSLLLSMLYWCDYDNDERMGSVNVSNGIWQYRVDNDTLYIQLLNASIDNCSVQQRCTAAMRLVVNRTGWLRAWLDVSGVSHPEGPCYLDDSPMIDSMPQPTFVTTNGTKVVNIETPNSTSACEFLANCTACTTSSCVWYRGANFGSGYCSSLRSSTLPFIGDTNKCNAAVRSDAGPCFTRQGSNQTYCTEFGPSSAELAAQFLTSVQRNLPDFATSVISMSGITLLSSPLTLPLHLDTVRISNLGGTSLTVTSQSALEVYQLSSLYFNRYESQGTTFLEKMQSRQSKYCSPPFVSDTETCETVLIWFPSPKGGAYHHILEIFSSSGVRGWHRVASHAEPIASLSDPLLNVQLSHLVNSSSSLSYITEDSFTVAFGLVTANESVYVMPSVACAVACWHGHCSPTDGLCICDWPWTGRFCNVTRKSYPVDVGSETVAWATCPSCGNGGECDNKTGTCSCDDGFSGPRCENACTPAESCDNGWWNCETCVCAAGYVWNASASLCQRSTKCRFDSTTGSLLSVSTCADASIETSSSTDVVATSNVRGSLLLAVVALAMVLLCILLWQCFTGLQPDQPRGVLFLSDPSPADSPVSSIHLLLPGRSR